MRTFLAWAFVLPMAVLVTELPSQAIADDVGVDGVPAFWFDYVEPRPDDDVRVCDLEKWESWRNSGNYSVMQTYYTVCRDGLRQLKRDLAGRNGPISDPALWSFMCGVECPISDMMHLMAMDYTGCRCMDLSTQRGSEFYRVPGDFCLENSARMLCNELGVCGHWGCDLEDFMCASHDFRRNYYRGYGYGDCSSAWGSLVARGSHPGLWALAMVLLVQVFIGWTTHAVDNR